MFWGLTPALDLIKEIKEYSSPNKSVNILLVGSADCRHVLKTLAKRYQHDNMKVNFYIMEACPETIAKQLLLLYVALQRETRMGLVQKTRYFMELFGNMVVRPAVANFLRNTAAGLVEMVTNYEYLKDVMPCVYLDLRHKERDYLENVFKFWRGCEGFDISDVWDKRVRKSLGVRYDNKKGAFDWDLHMRYRSVGGSVVGNQEYQSFRSSGVAFSWIESEVSKPNRSMVCGLLPNGNSYIHYGYMGDIITGPFVAYGLDCRDKEMMKTTNNVHLQRSTDVTEWNLREIFHEIHNGKEYVNQKINELNLGCLTTDLNDLKVIDSAVEGDYIKNKHLRKCIELPGARIIFISLNYLSTFDYKKEYHNFFDMIYFNFNYLKYIDPNILSKIAKPSSLLYIENQMFVLHFRDRDLEAFKVELQAKIGSLRYKKLKFDATKDNYFKLLLNYESRK